jgi:Yip1 domain
MTTAPMPASAPVVPPQSQISPFGRIIGVLFSPKPTFEDIVRKPGWLLPVVLLALFGLLSAVAVNQKVNWREYVSQQLEKSPSAAQLSADQKEQRIDAGAKIAPYTTYFFGTLGPIIGVLIVTLVMWGAYNLLAGANLNFKTSFGIVSYGFIPSIVGYLLFLLVAFLKPYGTLNLDNPVATNLAAFFPEDAPKWLAAAGKNIDIVILWVTMLIAIGFAAANPKKLKGAKSFTIAFGLLAVWIILRVGLAFVFS